LSTARINTAEAWRSGMEKFNAFEGLTQHARPIARTLRAGACGALAALALAVTASPAYPVSLKNLYTFQDVVDNKDVTFNQELGINNGTVIAGYFGSGAAGHPNKGYTILRRSSPNAAVKQSQFVNENFPGSVQTQVTGLNNSGAFSSLSLTKFIGVSVGFWSNQNNANMVNNNFGFVNIGGQNGTFVNVNNPNTGVVNGVKTNQLLGVNDFNTAVGFYVDKAGATHGYTYSITTKTFSKNIDDPHGVGATTAAAINDYGQIVGFYVDSAGVTHGFFDNGGVFTTIDVSIATGTSLLGINNFGYAVGFDVNSKNGHMHGIVCNVYTAACTQLDDPNGINTTTFNGINDLGQIVGFYVNGTGNTIGLLATPIFY
jgi:hypothetical protein